MRERERDYLLTLFFRQWIIESAAGERKVFLLIDLIGFFSDIAWLDNDMDSKSADKSLSIIMEHLNGCKNASVFFWFF